MKILLINNNTKHLDNLQKALIGHQIEVQKYRPGIDFNWQGKDLIVLSGGGGEGLEIKDFYKPGQLWYEDEMKFVRECGLPIMGICMGFEVIARAYRSEVKEVGKLVEGFLPIRLSSQGKKDLRKNHLSQFESHRWSVPAADTSEFDILATSPTGVEIIRHKSRKILATQFHPEKGGTLDLPILLEHLTA